MTPCTFCDIVANKSPNTKIEVKTGQYVMFKDIKPASTYHYLCVTEQHIESLNVMTREDIPLGIFKSQDIDVDDALFGFHLPPIISIKHLHLHVIAPRSNMTVENSFLYKPSSYWFKTVKDAKEYLKNKS